MMMVEMVKVEVEDREVVEELEKEVEELEGKWRDRGGGRGER